MDDTPLQFSVLDKSSDLLLHSFCASRLVLRWFRNNQAHTVLPTPEPWHEGLVHLKSNGNLVLTGGWSEGELPVQPGWVL